MPDTLQDLHRVFREVFEDDELVIQRSTQAVDVPGWDSLAHISLILRAESAFGVRMNSAEVADMQCVGDLVDAIERHLGKA